MNLGRIDDKYDIEVEQLKDAYLATMRIKYNDEYIYQGEVALSYGASFGIDIIDQNEIMEQACVIIDEYNKVGE